MSAELRRLVVLLPDAGVVWELAGLDADGVEDPSITGRLITREALVAELVERAYRPPRDATERAAAPGTRSTFLGPDRKAHVVPSALTHAWDQPAGRLGAWSSTLFGRRTERDWVARRPMHITRARPALYAKHLHRRLRAVAG